MKSLLSWGSVFRLAIFLVSGWLIQPPTAWSVDYSMDAVYPGPYDWGTAANWDPATGVPNDPADNATVHFSQTGAIDVDLGGNTYTVDTLTITEGDGNADGDFRNGTLNVSSILYTSGNRTIDFESNLTVNAGTNLLTLQTPQDNWLYFDGPVTGSGGLLFGGSGAVGSVLFRDYQITGNLELAANTDYAYLNFTGPAGGRQTVDSLTIADNDPFVIATGGSTSDKFTLEIAGTTTVNSDVTYARFYAYDGKSQVTLQGAVNFLRDGYCQLHLNGTGGGVLNVNGGLTTANPSQTLSIYSANGTVNIDAANPWSTRTGQTQIDGGAVCQLNLDAPDVLGSGNIVVRSGAQLRINFDTGTLGLPAGGYQFVNSDWVTWDAGGGAIVYTVAQTAQPAITVSRFNAIGGYVGTDITSGSPSITLEEDAVLVDSGANMIVNDDGSATVLTRAALGISAPTYWKAVDGTHDTYTVGPEAASADDPDNIYKGVAFTGARDPGTYWSAWYGTLNALPDERLQFVVASDVRFQPSGATKTELNAYDAANTVDAYGSGYMYLLSTSTETPIGGNWQVLNRYGQTNSQSVTLITFDRSGLAALAADKTVSIWDGVMRIYDSNAIEGTVNVNDGASIYLDRQMTTGTLNVNAGGAIWMNGGDRLEGLTLGTTLNVSSEALLVLYSDMNTATSTNLNQIMRTVDIVPDNTGADVFSGNGIVLGDGRRLMTSRSYDTRLSTSTVAVTAETGAAAVGLAAMPGRTLDIDCAVNLAGVDLVVGSDTEVTTVYGSANLQRYLLSPTGTVAIDGNVTCDDVTLESGTLWLRGASVEVADVTVNGGTLYMGNEATDVFHASGGMTVNGGIASLYHIALPSSMVVDGAVVVNSGGEFYCANTTNATDTLLAGLIAPEIVLNDGAQLRMEVNSAANGGTGPFVVTQKITITGDAANSTDNAQLWHDIQGSHDGPREVYYTDITLADGAVMGLRENDGHGRATITLAGNATVAQDGDATEFDLTGVSSSGGSYTLTIGQSETFSTVLRGPVDANTTVDLVNANLTLDASGQIAGSLLARPGSTFTVPGGVTTIGGDLTVLAGSTVNLSGAAVTVAGVLSGDGVVSGPVAVLGSVSPGLSPGTLTTGSLTLLDGSRLLFELDAPDSGAGSDLIHVEGDLHVDDGTVVIDVTGLDNFDYGGYTLITYTGSIFGDETNFVVDEFPAYFAAELVITDFGGSGGMVQLRSVPEPSALLMLLGFAGCLACGRRRKHAAGRQPGSGARNIRDPWTTRLRAGGW